MMNNVIYQSNRGIQLVPVSDELFQSRKLFLTGHIDDISANELIQKLLILEKDESVNEVELYINSSGGQVSSGLAIYDVLVASSMKIKTIVYGIAASMAAILFLAGDDRVMLKNSRVMIHDPSYANRNISGMKSAEIQVELDDLNRCRKVLAEIIAERTNKKVKDVYKLTAKDTYFTATEAIQNGIATRVLTKLKEDAYEQKVQ